MKKEDKRDKNQRFFHHAFFSKNRKGLSEVITTLILILLVLVAIGIIWVVIRGIVERGSEEISSSTGQFTINLDLKKVIVNSGSFYATVKRNPGQGELQGLAFSISDGSQSQVVNVNNIVLKELEEKTFNVPYSGLVKEISIAPIVKSGDGQGLLGDPQDNLKFTTKDALKNAGAVSWWRFEGNANDEIGENHGVNIGAILVSGKYGQGYSFNGAGNYINISNNPSIQLDNSNLTIVAWVYPKNLSNSLQGWSIVTKGDAWNLRFGYGFGLNTQYTRYLRFDRNNSNFIASSNPITLDQWSQVSVTHKIVGATSDRILYSNGVKIDNRTNTLSTNTLSSDPLNIGKDIFNFHYFNGTLDEVIIFNRALSSQEVEDLYNLNYND